MDHGVVRTRHAVPGLRSQRTAAGMTQKQIGLCIGKSQSYVSHLERGAPDATIAMIGALAYALGVAPEELLEEEGRTPADGEPP